MSSAADLICPLENLAKDLQFNNLAKIKLECYHLSFCGSAHQNVENCFILTAHGKQKS